jgi:hypothetical protein
MRSMNDTRKLGNILNEIEQVSNSYKERVNKVAGIASFDAPYVTESNMPESAQIGDFWYFLNRQELFICNGVVNGTPKWSSIYVD